MQREEVLYQIARKARERLAAEGIQPMPLPNKFLIPFLEKASLEEEDSELVDRWADLLASASAHPDRRHPRYPQILSEITSREARILRQVARTGFNESQNPYYDLYYKSDRSQSSQFKADYKDFLSSLPNDRGEVLHRCLTYFRVPGVHAVDVLRHWHDQSDRSLFGTTRLCFRADHGR